MAIEVTSIVDHTRTLSLRRTWRGINSFFHDEPLSGRRLFWRLLFGLFAMALIIGGDGLLRSYRYYSRLIDARLESGYLTSRPGLYAAPRVIQPGQKLSRADLIQALRREIPADDRLRRRRDLIARSPDFVVLHVGKEGHLVSL